MTWATANLAYPTIRTSPVRYGDQWGFENPDTKGRGLKIDYTRRLILKSRLRPRPWPYLWALRRDRQELMRARWRQRYVFSRMEYKSVVSGCVHCPLVGEDAWDTRPCSPFG
jgi:hypothetical protein